MTMLRELRERVDLWRAYVRPRDRLALSADALMVGWGVITATSGLLGMGLAFIVAGLAFAGIIIARVAKRSGGGLR